MNKEEPNKETKRQEPQPNASNGNSNHNNTPSTYSEGDHPRELDLEFITCPQERLSVASIFTIGNCEIPRTRLLYLYHKFYMSTYDLQNQLGDNVDLSTVINSNEILRVPPQFLKEAVAADGEDDKSRKLDFVSIDAAIRLLDEGNYHQSLAADVLSRFDMEVSMNLDLYDLLEPDIGESQDMSV